MTENSKTKGEQVLDRTTAMSKSGKLSLKAAAMRQIVLEDGQVSLYKEAGVDTGHRPSRLILNRIFFASVLFTHRI